MRLFGNPNLLLPAIFLAFFLIFLWGAAPTVFFSDSGELQTVALTGGVAHPSGYPTFILFGQLFGRILGGDPARRITIMSSFFGAAALCALFMVLRKLRLSAGISIVCTVIYGLSLNFWWSAIRAEVYTLAIFMFLVSLWLALHAFEKPTLLRAAAASAGLGLSMTGHLACAPAVMVLGIAILLSEPLRSNWRLSWPVIAVSFIAGLAPYLYLVWADSAGLPMNYLNYSIELGTNQYGLSEDTFSNPFRRIFWLIIGQESRRTNLHDVRFMALTSVQLFVSLFVYQLSILVLPLFVLGIRNMLNGARKVAWILCGMLAASAAFCVVVGNHRMLLVFEWPMIIIITILIAFGMQSFLRECIARGSARRLFVFSIGVMATVLMVGSSHLIRYHWDRSARISGAMKVVAEWDPPVDSVVLSLRDYREPRIQGEKLMKLIPENSLVVIKWKYMVLYYLHHVEGMRPDIELEPYDAHHFIRLRRWADTHDLDSHPIVFVGRVGGLVDDIGGLVELPVDEEESLYICRGPLLYDRNSKLIVDSSHAPFQQFHPSVNR